MSDISPTPSHLIVDDGQTAVVILPGRITDGPVRFGPAHPAAAA